MAVAEPGAIFGLSSFVENGGVCATTVVVNGSSAVLLKIPPPPPPPAGKPVASELLELASTLALQETQEIHMFLQRERCRPVAHQGNLHFKVRARSGSSVGAQL
jgi:hypothetical protein